MSDDFFGLDDYDGLYDFVDYLHEAVYERNIGRLEGLLREEGLDVNMQDQQGTTPLQAAVGGPDGDERIIRLLLRYGADVTGHGEGVYGNALAHAAMGSPRIMRMLLDHASAQANFDLSSASRALFEASKFENVEVVQLLLDRGVTPNATGPEYGCALQAATNCGSEDVVRALLAAGADVNFQGGHFGNALQAAAIRGSVNLVSILLEAGANVNAPGGAYANALASAREQNHPQVVDILLRAGATPV